MSFSPFPTPSFSASKQPLRAGVVKFQQGALSLALILGLIAMPQQAYAQATTISQGAFSATSQGQMAQGAPQRQGVSSIALAIETALRIPPADTLPQLNNERNRESTDYWLNALQASGGSAAGNALVFATFVGLDIVPAFLGMETSLIDSSGYLLTLLALIPAITTPLFMHLWSPAAQWEHALWSGPASLIAAGLHLGLMLGMGFWFNSMQWSSGLAPTFYLLAPAGFLSAVLIESLVTAEGHQLGMQFKKQRLQNERTRNVYGEPQITLAHFDF